MFEHSKSFADFHIAGFKHWDGIFILSSLKVGQKLELRPEFDNPMDPNAVAIYFEETKLGYIPRDYNPFIAQLIYFGHGDIFEAFVLGVDPEAEPWKQVRVGVRVRDVRR